MTGLQQTGEPPPAGICRPLSSALEPAEVRKACSSKPRHEVLHRARLNDMYHTAKSSGSALDLRAPKGEACITTQGQPAGVMAPGTASTSRYNGSLGNSLVPKPRSQSLDHEAARQGLLQHCPCPLPYNHWKLRASRTQRGGPCSTQVCLLLRSAPDWAMPLMASLRGSPGYGG